MAKLKQPLPPAVAIATRIVVVLLIVLVGAGIMAALETTAPQAASDDAPDRVQRVVVLEADRVEVRRQWRGYGVAKALDAADVPARVTAVVNYVPPDVQVGQSVEAGQTLVKLDASDFERQLELAQQRVAELQAQLDALEIERERLETVIELETRDVALAQSDLDEVQRQFNRGAANQRELDAAKRALISAERTLALTTEHLSAIPVRKRQLTALKAVQEKNEALARLNVERCEIKAPLSGVLAEVDVDDGESVTAGQRVARIVSLKRIEVPLQLPASARNDLVINGDVVLHATNETNLTWSAKIKRIAPGNDDQTRTVAVFVELEQPDAAVDFGKARNVGLLVPGMFVEGVAISHRSEVRWVVPRRAIRSGRILVVNDEGEIESRNVSVDYVREGVLPRFDVKDDQWAVLKDVPPTERNPGLRPGLPVLVNGSTSVRDGQKVEPVLADELTDEEASATTRRPNGQGATP